jgi:hypothetical protein
MPTADGVDERLVAGDDLLPRFLITVSGGPEKFCV